MYSLKSIAVAAQMNESAKNLAALNDEQKGEVEHILDGIDDEERADFRPTFDLSKKLKGSDEPTPSE